MLPLEKSAGRRGLCCWACCWQCWTCENEAEEDTGIPLVDLPPGDVDELAYLATMWDVTLLKGSEGNWMLDLDPTLPLEQESAVQSLVEKFTDLDRAPANCRTVSWARSPR